MKYPRRRSNGLASLVAAFLFVTAASSACNGQTDSRLLLEPWAEGRQWAETIDNIFAQSRGHTRDGADEDVQLLSWDSAGRVRFDRESPHPIAVGYRAWWMGIDSDHPTLPARMTDQALTLGLPLGEASGWRFGAVLGAGYAGDNAFGDPDAIYGIGHLIASKPVNETDALILTLDYNGNRTLLPDVPTPGIMYAHADPVLAYTLGFPASSVRWAPAERWALEASYTLPFSVHAQASYEFAEGWSVYGAFNEVFEANQLGDADDGDRIFFGQRTLEAGVRWVFGKWIDLTLAGGWAFDQEFEYGFDARDLDDTVEISDEPFVRLMVRGTF